MKPEFGLNIRPGKTLLPTDFIQRSGLYLSLALETPPSPYTFDCFVGRHGLLSQVNKGLALAGKREKATLLEMTGGHGSGTTWVLEKIDHALHRDKKAKPIYFDFAQLINNPSLSYLLPEQQLVFLLRDVIRHDLRGEKLEIGNLKKTKPHETPMVEILAMVKEIKDTLLDKTKTCVPVLLVNDIGVADDFYLSSVPRKRRNVGHLGLTMLDLLEDTLFKPLMETGRALIITTSRNSMFYSQPSVRKGQEQYKLGGFSKKDVAELLRRRGHDKTAAEGIFALSKGHPLTTWRLLSELEHQKKIKLNAKTVVEENMFLLFILYRTLMTDFKIGLLPDWQQALLWDVSVFPSFNTKVLQRLASFRNPRLSNLQEGDFLDVIHAWNYDLGIISWDGKKNAYVLDPSLQVLLTTYQKKVDLSSYRRRLQLV